MQHFVTEFEEFLAPFQSLGDRIPTIDTDALLDILIEHIEKGQSISWYDYARELLYSGQIIETIYLSGETNELHYLDERRKWENIPFARNDSDQLVDAIARVGISLEAHLKYWGLYRDGLLQYAFQGRINHDLFEFVKKPFT